MTKLVAGLLLLMSLLVGVPAIADPLEDAELVRTKWAEAFNAGAVDTLVAMYTGNTLFYGSTAPLFKGADGVRSHFSHLPPGLQTQLSEQSAIAIQPNVILSSGLVSFKLKDGPPAPYRLTLALVKVDGRWLIAQQHASQVPVPKP
jgi:ketosteroid isomerase-like protein